MLYVANQMGCELVGIDACTLQPVTSIPSPGRCYRVLSFRACDFFFGGDVPSEFGSGRANFLVASGSVPRPQRRTRGFPSCVTVHSLSSRDVAHGAPIRCFSGYHLFPESELPGLALVQGTALDSSPLVLTAGRSRVLICRLVDPEKAKAKPGFDLTSGSICHGVRVARILHVPVWPGNDVVLGGETSWQNLALRLCDLRTQKSLDRRFFRNRPDVGIRGSLTALAADAENHRLFVGMPDDRTLRVFDMRAPQAAAILGTYNCLLEVGGRPMTLFYAADLHMLLLGCTGGVFVLDCRKMRLRESRIDVLTGVEEFARIDRFTFAATTYSRGVGIFDLARGLQSRGLRDARGGTGICFVGREFEDERLDEDERLGFWLRRSVGFLFEIGVVKIALLVSLLVSSAAILNVSSEKPN